MKIKITRRNFIRYVFAVYVLVICLILGIKWVAHAAHQKKVQQRAREEAGVSSPADYTSQLNLLKSAVSSEGRRFVDAAKDRLAGKSVARMSDLNAAIKDSLKSYFDADERRLRLAARQSQSPGDADSGSRRNIAENADQEFTPAAGSASNVSPAEVLTEQLNLKVRFYLLGVGSLIESYNAERAFGGPVSYDLDIDRTEFVGADPIWTDLAKVTFPSGNEWIISFDAVASSGDFLGGIELRMGDSVLHSLALVVVKGAIQLIDNSAKNPQLRSADEVLSSIKNLLDAELTAAKTKARSALGV